MRKRRPVGRNEQSSLMDSCTETDKHAVNILYDVFNVNKMYIEICESIFISEDVKLMFILLERFQIV